MTPQRIPRGRQKAIRKAVAVILLVAILVAFVGLVFFHKGENTASGGSSIAAPAVSQPTAGGNAADVAKSERTRNIRGASMPSARSRDGTSGAIDTSFENVKRILDGSMAAQGATYFNHQEISTPGGSDNTVSFVYFRNPSGNVALPTVEEVTASAKSSENLRIAGHSLMQQARQEQNNETAQRAAAMLVEADRQLTQEDRFYTVEVAKDTNLPPVVMFQPGLPEWLALKSKALSLAERHFGEPANVVGVERNVLGAECIFVASNSRGETLFINGRSEKVFTGREQVASQRPPRRVNPQEEAARIQRIQSQWQDFMANGFDLKSLSPDGLLDLSTQHRK